MIKEFKKIYSIHGEWTSLVQIFVIATTASLRDSAHLIVIRVIFVQSMRPININWIYSFKNEGGNDPKAKL